MVTRGKRWAVSTDRTKRRRQRPITNGLGRKNTPTLLYETGGRDTADYLTVQHLSRKTELARLQSGGV